MYKRMLRSENILGSDYLSTLNTVGNLAVPSSTLNIVSNLGLLDAYYGQDDENESSKSFDSVLSDESGSASRLTNPFSLSHRAATKQSTSNRLYMSFFSYKIPAEHETDERNDIQLLPLIEDDIGSRVDSNSGVPGWRHAVVTYLVKMLTNNSDLLALYEKAA